MEGTYFPLSGHPAWCKKITVAYLITFLKAQGFDPRPSLGQEIYFSVDSQKGRINVSIVTDTGVRVFY